MTAIRKLAIVVALAASLAVVVASPAAAKPSHGWDVRCGQSFADGFGWFDLKGYNVACSVARKVANKYTFGQDPSPKDWRCREVQIGDEVWRTNCIRNKDGAHQHIRFKYGA
jgi:hypothetical protein